MQSNRMTAHPLGSVTVIAMLVVQGCGMGEYTALRRGGDVMAGRVVDRIVDTAVAHEMRKEEARAGRTQVHVHTGSASASHQQTGGGRLPALWSTYFESADAEYEKGRFAEAEQLYKSALREAERAELPQSIREVLIANTANDLGNALFAQDKLSEARAVYERSLRISEQQNLHELAAMLLGNLGNVAYRDGRFGDADALYREAINRAERRGESMYPLLGYVLAALGSRYVEDARYEDAEVLLRRSIRLSEGRDDRVNVYALAASVMSQVYIAQLRYADAEALLSGALARQPGVSQQAMLLVYLGTLHSEQGNHQEARNHHRRALRVVENEFGWSHMIVGYALSRTYPETCFALCNISAHDDETHGRATGLDL